ncbi:MAG: hypothetical protein ABIY47_03495 [Opitutaceae bacterium]
MAPPEFDVTIFANADQANYPASVAATPDGTVYVASDANGSLGVDLGRGRIVRLRDAPSSSGLRLSAARRRMRPL